MSVFEQSFVAEFEKVALSKTNILNAPTGAPKNMKNALGDVLAAVLGGGAGAVGGYGLGSLGADENLPQQLGMLGAGTGAVSTLLARSVPREAAELKELGVRPKLGRLGAAALGAGGGGVLAGLIALLASKGFDVNVEPEAKAIKGALFGGLLGAASPSSIGGVEKLPVTPSLKNKLKALISKN